MKLDGYISPVRPKKPSIQLSIGNMNNLVALFVAVSISAASGHYHGENRHGLFFGGQGFAGQGFPRGGATIAGPTIGPYNLNGPSFGPSEVNGPRYGHFRLNGPTFGQASITGPRVAAATVTGAVNEGAVLSPPVFGGVRLVNRPEWNGGNRGDWTSDSWGEHEYEHY